VRNKNYPIFFIIAFVVIIGTLTFLRSDIVNLVFGWRKKGLPPEIGYSQSPTPSKSSGATQNPPPTTKPSGSINLAVPFMAQAPTGNWELPYQEACEETSAILVDGFYKNKTLTTSEAEEAILKLVTWEKKRFGYYFHTTSEETAIILREYFGYRKVEVLPVKNSDDIKQQLFAGRPVIVAFSGRDLKNPYYTAPGPAYHMLVIKGVTEEGDFITNDVGTKRGHNYIYDDQVIYQAIHDAPTGGDGWPLASEEDYIKSGDKVMIVVYPN